MRVESPLASLQRSVFTGAYKPEMLSTRIQTTLSPKRNKNFRHKAEPPPPQVKSTTPNPQPRHQETPKPLTPTTLSSKLLCKSASSATSAAAETAVSNTLSSAERGAVPLKGPFIGPFKGHDKDTVRFPSSTHKGSL